MEELEFDACIDKQDDRDYKYEEIFWIEETLPNEYIIDDVNDYQNQWLEEISKYMCVFYSSTHWVNIMNELEWVWEEDKSWKDSWLYAHKKWLLDLKTGAYLSSWPKIMKELWYIKWYALITTIEEAKRSIVNWRPIVVWSNRLKWWWPCEAKQSYWHAVLIIWYNKDWFIIKQSYWKEKYNEWKNLLLYKDFNLLYNSKYSLIDIENPILSYKKQVMENIDLDPAKVWFLLWLYNWKNNTSPITRQEAVSVIVRALEKMLKWEITSDSIKKAFEDIK